MARCLLPLAALFGIASALHRAMVRIGFLRSRQLAVPVIVVGNLVVGGAGKTPTVIALVAHLRARGFTPGIVSRGYGRDSENTIEVQMHTPASVAGDEPLLIRLRTGAPVVVSHDRVAAGQELLARHREVDIVISDDGLQHHRLSRQVQLLVFDERGVGNGWLLPAGPLREPLPASVPPHSLVVYNAAKPSTPLAGFLAKRSLRGVCELGSWWSGEGSTRPLLDALKGRPVLAVAGLARPERFFDMLREHGLSIDTLALPDHHDYAQLPWPADTPDVIVTEKDAVKLMPTNVGATRVWVATLDFEFDAAFNAALATLITPSPRPPAGTDHGNAIA